jgi:signal transduction histidine kinase
MLLVFLPPATLATTLELSEANVTVTVQGRVSQETTTLPYQWDRHNKGLSGTATFELHFDLADAPQVPFGLYIPRMGNAYEVWVNGTLLETSGNLLLPNGADFAKVPRHIVVPPGILHGNSNVLLIYVRADVQRRGGLAPVTVGPEPEIYRLYQPAFLAREVGVLIVVVVSLLIGFMAMALWLTQVDTTVPGRGHRDPLYLTSAIAELSWAMCAADILIENPPLPWPWWGMFNVSAATIWTMGMTLFCIEVAGWSKFPATRLLRRWFALELLGLLPALILAFDYGRPEGLTALYTASTVASAVFVCVFVAKAARGATLAHRVVALALLINTLAALRDLYVFRYGGAYGGIFLLHYSSVFFGLSLALVVLFRFHTASFQSRDLTANLALRISQKEQELTHTYQQLDQFARQQERGAERTRILQDMHDGVGAHISTAIRQLQSGQTNDNEVLQTLHESLDQLKLSIDAMTMPAGDVTALLANLRYRLEPRFKASDIELQWDVALLDPLPRLDDKGMRNLQFLVYGAIANVLQHAGASMLRIDAQGTEQGIRLRIVDNGCGFDTRVPMRKGLLSMDERAKAIGATMAVRSAPGSTTVEILIA